MIEVKNLNKAYGDVQALSDASLSVQPGEIVGLLGPNGAGKTTMIKCLTGYIQPDSGSITVDDIDVITQPLEAQKRIGYLPENAPLYPEQTVQNYLKMIAELRAIPDADKLQYISDAVIAVGMEQHLTRPIGTLSKGYRQRLGLAQAILHKPAFLILDEPTVGLDPTQIVEIRNLIRTLAQNSTILFSTHILPEVEVLCDRVVILINGKVKTDERLADLEKTTNTLLVLERDQAGAASALKALAGVKSVDVLPSENAGVTYRVHGNGQAGLNSSIFKLAAEHGWPVVELRNDARLLESVFTELTTAATGD